jgi:hypothetical protein
LPDDDMGCSCLRGAEGTGVPDLRSTDSWGDGQIIRQTITV